MSQEVSPPQRHRDSIFRESQVEKLAEKSFRSFLVASALHEDVESIAVLVHCPPKILRFPVDLQVHFIQVPCVSTTRTATT
jgi:predicted glycosyltransferase